MSRLNGFPQGLLSLLGSQNFGEAPRDLSQVIIPNIDCTELYLASQQRIEVAIQNPLVNGAANTAIVVPPGEIWRVFGVSVFCTCGAGVSAVVTPVYQQDVGTLALGPTVAIAANQTRWSSMTVNPFWATAGSRLVTYGGEIVGAPVASTCVLAARLRA